MRSNLFKTSAFIGVIALVLSACYKDHYYTTNLIRNQIERNLETDTWKVFYYSDSGIDKTEFFEGYVFDFRNDGTVIAENWTNIFKGFWNITVCKNNHGSLEDLHLNVNFNLANQFKYLNNEWDFLSQTVTKIELYDKESGSGESDYLTFKKI